MIRQFFKWIFKSEAQHLNEKTKKIEELISRCELQERKLKKILENIDISVDVDHSKYSPSWAVISLQGENTDYIKFIDLGPADIHHIQNFLRQFEYNYNIKVDATPGASQFLRIKRDNSRSL